MILRKAQTRHLSAHDAHLEALTESVNALIRTNEAQGESIGYLIRRVEILEERIAERVAR